MTYENYTIQQLKERLRTKGLKVSGTKSELIQRLRKGGNNKKSPKKSSPKKSNTIPNNIIDKALYRRIKNKVKKRVKVWPSAYASGQLVSEYKRAGGRYKNQKSKSSSLDRWYKENWVDVCRPSGIGYRSCGRKQSSARKYPYCRPSKRINSKTPMTASEMVKKYGKNKIKEMCKKKRSKGLPKNKKPKRIRM